MDFRARLAVWYTWVHLDCNCCSLCPGDSAWYLSLIISQIYNKCSGSSTCVIIDCRMSSPFWDNSFLVAIDFLKFSSISNEPLSAGIHSYTHHIRSGQFLTWGRFCCEAGNTMCISVNNCRTALHQPYLLWHVKPEEMPPNISLQGPHLSTSPWSPLLNNKFKVAWTAVDLGVCCRALFAAVAIVRAFLMAFWTKAYFPDASQVISIFLWDVPHPLDPMAVLTNVARFWINHPNCSGANADQNSMYGSHAYQRFVHIE